MVQGQEVVSVRLPLIVVMVGVMVMPLALRGGLAAVGHCLDEVGLSTVQKTFLFGRRNIL